MMDFAAFWIPVWDTSIDPLLLHRHSKIMCFRWWNSILDVLDIAGGATGAWTLSYPYNSIGTTFTTGACIAYDPIGNNGKYAFISLNATQNFVRFNVLTNDINEWAYLRQTQGTALVGKRMYTTHAYNTEWGVVPILGHILSNSNIHHETFITT
jgi:hypothetical protein